MNEIYKGFIGAIIMFLLWSGGMFVGGYFFRDRQATKELNDANQQLAEKQREYDELIRTSDERIRNIKNELFGKVSSNGEATRELSKLIEQIKKQRIDL